MPYNIVISNHTVLLPGLYVLQIVLGVSEPLVCAV